ncbi:MAG: hypothetical protein ACTSQH_09550, partial [Candidatus Hodarchaeales archaeon]
ISATILIIGFLPLLFAIKDRDRLWNLKYVYFALIFVGILLEIAAAVVYGFYFEPLWEIQQINWS